MSFDKAICSLMRAQGDRKINDGEQAQHEDKTITSFVSSFQTVLIK
jgi:hypothetical protein